MPLVVENSALTARSDTTLLEITGDYYWRLLLEITTGDYWRLLEITGEYWRLLEITTGDYWRLLLELLEG